jgi:hypothetical protein
MKQLVLAVVALIAATAAAEEKATFQGLEVAITGVERVKAYRDLKAKHPKKDDLVVVKLEVRWTADTRHVLFKDDDLALRDARGKTHRCALGFVQAAAPADGARTTIEIPFEVKAEAAIASIRLGKTWLPIDSPASEAR